MALYIDPPQWPAHGTVFSHLVSDHSYAELHAFAESIGISRRAFDVDHYDVPAEFYDAAVQAGAAQVSGVELVRLLRQSGLRVPARERIEKVVPILRHQWQQIEPNRLAVGEELLSRWSQGRRHYHTPVHLFECLTALDELAQHTTGRSAAREVVLAAWFHDAVYEGKAGEDEERSAELAAEALGGELGQEVARLVLLTRDHTAAPGDQLGGLLIDADLSILAAPRSRYRRYVNQVREEYAHVPDNQWRVGRHAVLKAFSERARIYSTPAGNHLWGERARGNLDWEIELLARE